MVHRSVLCSAPDRGIDELDFVDVVDSTKQVTKKIAFLPVFIRLRDDRIGHKGQRPELRGI